MPFSAQAGSRAADRCSESHFRSLRSGHVTNTTVARRSFDSFSWARSSWMSVSTRPKQARRASSVKVRPQGYKGEQSLCLGLRDHPIVSDGPHAPGLSHPGLLLARRRNSSGGVPQPRNKCSTLGSVDLPVHPPQGQASSPPPLHRCSRLTTAAGSLQSAPRVEEVRYRRTARVLPRWTIFTASTLLHGARSPLTRRRRPLLA